MPRPGRRARGARAAMRKDVFTEHASIDAARLSYRSELLRDIASKAAIDLDKIEEEARRRHKVERRRIERAEEAASQRYAKELKESRQELRAWLDDYLENVFPVYEKMAGNPILWSATPVEVEINSDPNTPGTGGGTFGHRRAFWTSSCDYDLGVGHQRHNIFHPFLQVDNQDDQHTHTSSWLEIVVRFEIEPPEGDWFLGERIWAPLMGRGEERFFEGFLSCSDHLPLLNRPGCYHETIKYDIRVDQPGQNYTDYDLSSPSNPDMDYITVRRKPYCGGLDGGLLMISTEPIVFSDIGGFMYDIPGLLLRGRDQDGRPVTVEVRIEFSTGVYFEHERHEMDFRDPDWLQLPWVMIYGRRVDL